ncbi:tRNA-dihydrouridine synthase [Eikenella sp. S3360]|uniref:tRNA-dihydrouridine(16) synthase n=1 Tax=Eikenella glucosivorans TaxID=2766967 RepID=A0ABS0N9D3_9NEIS|nr:tRNA-dihydrouridine synthase [Eikenella glucosivorans]MBH5328904.1 tRNA-dihydrouridine synthase [Eikenella glucosivorans]
MNLILAPMQGLLDPVMRHLLTRIGGYSECVTEFVRITHTLHSRATWRRHMPEIDHGCRTPAGTPCTLQLLGSDPENMAANACAAAAAGARKIDLNFGCPAPTVNKHQGGAILLREPERIRQIVSTVRQRLPENIPLTAKMRLGYDSDYLAIECAQAIAQGGAAALAVHARTKTQGYRPPAHWPQIARIRQAVSIPVIANGDVFSLADYLAIRQSSGCHSVMIGRGAVITPDLGRQIARHNQGLPPQPAPFADYLVWMRQFFQLCRQAAGDTPYPVARLKQWLGMMKPHHPQAEQLFARLRTLTAPADVEHLLENYPAD